MNHLWQETCENELLRTSEALTTRQRQEWNISVLTKWPKLLIKRFRCSLCACTFLLTRSHFFSGLWREVFDCEKCLYDFNSISRLSRTNQKCGVSSLLWSYQKEEMTIIEYLFTIAIRTAPRTLSHFLGISKICTASGSFLAQRNCKLNHKISNTKIVQTALIKSKPFEFDA